MLINTHCRRQWHPTPVLLPGKSHGWRSLVGCSPWGPKSRTRLSDFTFTFHFHSLEKEMATHSNVLAWRIPGTGEPGGLPSMGLHRVGHDWSNLTAVSIHTHTYDCRKISKNILQVNFACNYLGISLVFNSLHKDESSLTLGLTERFEHMMKYIISNKTDM